VCGWSFLAAPRIGAGARRRTDAVWAGGSSPDDERAPGKKIAGSPCGRVPAFPRCARCFRPARSSLVACPMRRPRTCSSRRGCAPHRCPPILPGVPHHRAGDARRRVGGVAGWGGWAGRAQAFVMVYPASRRSFFRWLSRSERAVRLTWRARWMRSVSDTPSSREMGAPYRSRIRFASTATESSTEPPFNAVAETGRKPSYPSGSMGPWQTRCW